MSKKYYLTNYQALSILSHNLILRIITLQYLADVDSGFNLKSLVWYKKEKLPSVDTR